MAEILTAGVNHTGTLIIPLGVREKQNIEQGSILFQTGWENNILLVPAGVEVQLIDFLIKGGLESNAKTRSSAAKREYSSPLNTFRKAEIGGRNTFYVGTRRRRSRMAVIPVGDGIVITPTEDALSVYKGLPDHPNFTWAMRPEVSQHALAESYEAWCTRNGQEVAKGRTTINLIPENSNGLERTILVAVTKDIFKSAINQIK